METDMPRALLLNHVILFLCCSVYLGAGVSLVLFHFPLEPRLAPDNYHLVFVDPVTNAARFFTGMTIVMLATGAVMLLTEWFTGIRWVPALVLIALIASIALTMFVIMPLNRELAAGILDGARLKLVFARWANLNRLRAALWAVEWGAMMYWFYRLAWQSRADA
jgi:hypothetical protein